MTATSAPAVQLAPAKQDWTLAATLRSAAAARPAHVALRSMHGNELTYAQVLSCAESRAVGLQQLGISPGDRVALLMDNSLEMILTWFAVNLLGAVEVPCNTANRGRSLEHVLGNSGAGVVVVDSTYAPVLAEVAGALPELRAVVVHGADVELPWPTHRLETLTGPREDLSQVPCSYRDPAAIIYTSGTTGPAKGVVVSHAHMYLFARHVVEQLEISHDDVYYVCLPLFHANAQFMQVYAAMIASATVVLADAFSASRWVEEVHACGATVSSLLGVMAQYIYNQPPSELDTRHRVRRMITIPLPAAIAEDFERRFGVISIEAYGMTEVCLPTYRPKDEPLRPGSCGKVLEEWFEVAVVDPDTDEVLPVGEVGEIVVRPRSPYTTFLEYHAMPERTVESWRNLWFHTGDAGRRDADGYYFFVDRIKDRIRRKGENVTAYDIEVALMEIEGVREVAVVAKAAAEGEDDIKAYLVVADETAADPVAILQHCTARLPYFAVPRYIEIISEMPKTPNGKILKRELRSRSGSKAEWDRESAGWTVRRGDAGLVRRHT
jgi:crotonobetaine/carnitine-CoA ligase